MSVWFTHWNFLFSDSHLCLIISSTATFFTLSSLLPNPSKTFVFTYISTFSFSFLVLMSHVLTPSSGQCSPLSDKYSSHPEDPSAPSGSHIFSRWTSNSLDRLIKQEHFFHGESWSSSAKTKNILWMAEDLKRGLFQYKETSQLWYFFSPFVFSPGMMDKHSPCSYRHFVIPIWSWCATFCPKLNFISSPACSLLSSRQELFITDFE